MLETLSSAPESLAAPSREALDQAIARATEALLAQQHEDGHWCAELQGDSILESEYILLKWILGQENDPDLIPITNYLRNLQGQDGGWSMFPGGSADLSGTVKAYFCLKLMGDDPSAPHMQKARYLIRQMGGAERCNTFSRFYLACLGQISFDACPAIPPEIVFLPKWFYFNLYNVAAWTRTMILPLGIVTTFRKARELPPEKGIAELYLSKEDGDRLAPPTPLFPTNWREIFIKIDSLLKLYNKRPIASLREDALKAAEQWILSRLEGSEGLGAIFPPMVYILIVFRLLGYKDDHPTVQLAHKHLKDFFIKDPEKNETRIQPCFSPVWDTGLALHALNEASPEPLPEGGVHSVAQSRGVGSLHRKTQRGPTQLQDPQPQSENLPPRTIGRPSQPTPRLCASECTPPSGRSFDAATSDAAQRATQWLLSKECRQPSDWALHTPSVEASGWFFEYENKYYPDVDDTAMAVVSLHRAGREESKPAITRGINWLLAMQNDDGGWAAFDKTKGRPLLELIPFADHNAMQDPSCPDITGRVLECLGNCDPQTFNPKNPIVRRAIAFMASQQDASGAWWGRWGVNFIYGTWQVLTGLRAVGADMNQLYIKQAAAWLKSVQKPDGSFGETARSYEDPSLKGQGPSTASQTAWGGMGLLAVHGPEDPAVQRAAHWLIENQRFDGNWDESWYTGTGFPKVFYLKYHLYRLYFPLTFLARLRRRCGV